MIQANYIDRETLNVRSSGDSRKRVDAYFVSYRCPPDDINPGPALHEWMCRFEVPRGTEFRMTNFPNKAAALAARSYRI